MHYFSSLFGKEFFTKCGARGGVVVKALRCWSDGPGIDSLWCHLGFFPW